MERSLGCGKKTAEKIKLYWRRENLRLKREKGNERDTRKQRKLGRERDTERVRERD